MRQLPRYLSAVTTGLPDAITASVFLYAWIKPLAHEGFVATMLLVMLIEFIVVHSSAFFGGIALSETATAVKVKGLLGVGVFYAIFVGSFAAAFAAWWPIWWFGWLLGSMIFGALFDQSATEQRREHIQALWAASAMLYLFGVFFTLFFPLPRLGLQPDVVAQLGLAGSGEWIDNPHKVIAFGTIYFASMALFRAAQIITDRPLINTTADAR